jgi:hypothetical protein
MWKQTAIGAAALLIGGSVMVYAQQQPGNPGVAPAPQPAQAAPQPGQGMGGWHVSPQDMAAFADARIAALHAGLELNADQEKSWAPFEQALRELSKMRIAHFEARRKAMMQPPSQTPPDPIERLQKRADAMATRGAALKRLADAAAPLYQSLDDAQKHRFAVLARMLRPHGHHHPMWRWRMGEGFGNGMRGGMEGDFHHRFGEGDRGGMRDEFHMGPHRFGDHGMRDPRHMRDGDGDKDYHGPL